MGLCWEGAGSRKRGDTATPASWVGDGAQRGLFLGAPAGFIPAVQGGPGTSWEGARWSAWAWGRRKGLGRGQSSLRVGEPAGAEQEASWICAVAHHPPLPPPHPLTGLAISEHLQERRAGIYLLLPSGSAARAVRATPELGLAPPRGVGMWAASGGPL